MSTVELEAISLEARISSELLNSQLELVRMQYEVGQITDEESSQLVSLKNGIEAIEAHIKTLSRLLDKINLQTNQ